MEVIKKDLQSWCNMVKGSFCYVRSLDIIGVIDYNVKTDQLFISGIYGGSIDCVDTFAISFDKTKGSSTQIAIMSSRLSWGGFKNCLFSDIDLLTKEQYSKVLTSRLTERFVQLNKNMFS